MLVLRGLTRAGGRRSTRHVTAPNASIDLRRRRRPDRYDDRVVGPPRTDQRLDARRFAPRGHADDRPIGLARRWGRSARLASRRTGSVTARRSRLGLDHLVEPDQADRHHVPDPAGMLGVAGDDQLRWSEPRRRARSPGSNARLSGPSPPPPPRPQPDSRRPPGPGAPRRPGLATQASPPPAWPGWPGLDASATPEYVTVFPSPSTLSSTLGIVASASGLVGRSSIVTGPGPPALKIRTLPGWQSSRENSSIRDQRLDVPNTSAMIPVESTGRHPRGSRPECFAQPRGIQP